MSGRFEFGYSIDGAVLPQTKATMMVFLPTKLFVTLQKESTN
jgi:hypothetical protein